MEKFGATIKAQVATFREKLKIDAAWALRGLVVLYAHQTAEEKATGATYNDNGVGFSGFDGGILSSFAKQYVSRSWLSKKQMDILHKRMPKYARQLRDLAARKVETVA